MKLIDLEGMVAALHEITRLINLARLTERHQVHGLIERDLLFKLITTQDSSI